MPSEERQRNDRYRVNIRHCESPSRQRNPSLTYQISLFKASPLVPYVVYTPNATHRCLIYLCVNLILYKLMSQNELSQFVWPSTQDAEYLCSLILRDRPQIRVSSFLSFYLLLIICFNHQQIQMRSCRCPTTGEILPASDNSESLLLTHSGSDIQSYYPRLHLTRISPRRSAFR